MLTAGDGARWRRARATATPTPNPYCSSQSGRGVLICTGLQSVTHRARHLDAALLGATNPNHWPGLHASPVSCAGAGANPGDSVPNSRLPRPISFLPSRFGTRDPGSKLDESLALHPPDVAQRRKLEDQQELASITNAALPNPIAPGRLTLLAAACNAAPPRDVVERTMGLCSAQNGSVYYPPTPSSLSRRPAPPRAPCPASTSASAPRVPFCRHRLCAAASFTPRCRGPVSLSPLFPRLGGRRAAEGGAPSHPLCYILPSALSPLSANGCSTSSA